MNHSVNQLFLKPNFFRILAGLILVSVFYSMTLPHYEAFNDSIIHNNYTKLHVRPNPQQSGMFSGGYYTIHNGLGSIFAILNLGICTLLFSSLFFKKVRKSQINLLLIFFIATHLLTAIGNYFTGYLLTPSDTLFVGYYWLLIGEMALFTIVYYTKKFPGRINNRDILDDQTELEDHE